jgi:2-methylcitrate dehydratase PrpD
VGVEVNGDRLDRSGSLSEQLAAYWAEVRFDDLPAAVVSHAKRFLLDTLAAGVAGCRTDVVQAVITAMRAEGQASGTAGLWGRADTLPPGAAALVNGTASHALELDDFGGCGHSGAVTVPAVCALAEGRSITGKEALVAIVAGYDVASRVLAGCGGYRPHNARGWHSTGTCGTFGAAAAAAKLLGASADSFTHALGIAGTYTGGLWAFLTDGAMVKRFHPGKASQTGVSAALLAQAGLTGPRKILDAEWGGFYPTYAGDAATPERTIAGLGEEFHIALSGIKPYACCRTLHSCIDAALAIVGDASVPNRNAREIAGLIVHGDEQTVRQFRNTTIGNLLEAQFSAPYCVAVAIESGRATLDQFQPLRTDAAEIRRLMTLTEIRADRVLGPKDYPSLEVVFADGGREIRDVPYAKGAPEAPLTDRELIGKARTLLVPALGDASTEALTGAIWELDRLDDFSIVTRLLRVPGEGNTR